MDLDIAWTVKLVVGHPFARGKRNRMRWIGCTVKLVVSECFIRAILATMQA